MEISSQISDSCGLWLRVAWARIPGPGLQVWIHCFSPHFISWVTLIQFTRFLSLFPYAIIGDVNTLHQRLSWELVSNEKPWIRVDTLAITDLLASPSHCMQSPQVSHCRQGSEGDSLWSPGRPWGWGSPAFKPQSWYFTYLLEDWINHVHVEFCYYTLRRMILAHDILMELLKLCEISGLSILSKS